ncbi:MAG: hypothetical protein JW940_22330 [Polyangiaceae bacterium]|nr:hypothetical protein [Polyangiaceae bacterium]
MDATTALIQRVTTPGYGRVAIDASDGWTYLADLRWFEAVYCFPRTESAWHEVAPDSSGYALIWTSRFEVHVDQVMALATRVEPSKQTA